MAIARPPANLVFNLLPLPPLDGAFVLVGGFEVFLSALLHQGAFNTGELAPLGLLFRGRRRQGLASTVLDVVLPVDNPF